MPEPIADQLERASAKLDRLIHDARLRPHLSPDQYHALEERAQAIAGAVVASFRGVRPASAAPLDMQRRPGGCSALW